jgi:hypothetical protein
MYDIYMESKNNILVYILKCYSYKQKNYSYNQT